MKPKFLLFLVALLWTLGSNAQTYCTPAYTSGCSVGDDINTITLTAANTTSINQPNTGCSANAYADYTGLAPTHLIQGATYTGTMNSNYPSAEYVRIWIDFDNNGVFAATEQVGLISNMGTALVTYNITIPATATLGLHRMRYRLVFATTANTIDPCTSYSYGETHDYLTVVMSTGSCSGTPVLGAAQASPQSVCTGMPTVLSLASFPYISGLSYQWQSAPATTGPWTAVGGALLSPVLSVSPTATTYYRCVATCGASSATSSVVTVTVPPAFPAGTYTINDALPTAGTNFNSVTDAVAAISCGIAGPVVFNAVPGSGPYVEQITIPNVPNSSATNTITFNGNYDTLTYVNTGSNSYAVLNLRGADYVTFKKWTIVASPQGSYGWGVYLNNADHNVIDSNKIYSSETIASTVWAGIVMSGSATSATSSGSLADSNIISNNFIKGGYYGITNWGSSTTTKAEGNRILGNTIEDFYYMGIYSYYNNQLKIEKNDISRPTRANPSYFYGIYSYYCGNGFLIAQNKVHDPFATDTNSTLSAYGIMTYYSNASAADPVKMVNNVVYHFKLSGYAVGMYDYSNANSLVAYNTIALNHHSGSSTTYGLYYYATNATIKNNIFDVSRNSSGVTYAIYRSSGSFVSDYNDFYTKPNNTTSYVGYFGGAQATLAAWQSASAGDANSKDLNPIFDVDFVDSLYPTNDTLDDMCLPIAGFPTDIVDKVRKPLTPDVGAFEFSRKCDGPGFPGVVHVSDTGMCSGYKITLTDTSYQKDVSWLDRTWQESYTLGNTWYNIAGSVNKDTIMPVFPHNTMYYRVMMVCRVTGDTTYSNAVRVILKPQYKCYCYSMAEGGQKADSSDIGSFTIQSFSTNSGGPHVDNPVAVRSRTDFTDHGPIVLYKDSTYSVGIYHTMSASVHANAQVTMFLDYNNNSVYDYLTNEAVSVSAGGNWITSDPNGWYLLNNFTVPNAVITNVPTGMRIILNNDLDVNNTASRTACGGYTSGETEDYVVIFKEKFPTSIQTIQGVEEFAVYPNPSDGLFTARFKAQASLGNVQLIAKDVTGRVIKSAQYGTVNGLFTQQVDLSSEAKGVYFIELKVDDQRIVEKVIVK